MGDSSQNSGRGFATGGYGGGPAHFRPNPQLQAHPGLVGPQAPPIGNPNLRPQHGPKQMASPEPNLMAPPQASMFPGGKMGPQYGLASNPFMWGGGQAPVLNAQGNPANANFMGTFNGHRLFMPGDSSW